MLYNESTGKPKIQADVFSLGSLIAWLETMPPEQTYDYCKIGECLVAQYLQSHNMRRVRLLPEELAKLGWANIAHGFEDGFKWTFGAAHSRARAALQVAS